MKAHRSKRSLKTETGDTSPLGLSVSASRAAKDLVVTLVNPKHDTSMTVNASISGASAVSAKAQLLHHSDMNAFNSFDEPDVIVPKVLNVVVEGSKLKVELPALSVATIQVPLA
jgi:alpha-L-arabinofuranosidase